MIVTTWNVRAGGGRRIAAIADVILKVGPDLIVFTEYRTAPGKRLLELLAAEAYNVQASPPEGSQNAVCLLSKSTIEPLAHQRVPQSRHRWVAARLPESDLNVLGVHVPNQSEKWNKNEFWECLEAFAAEFLTGRRIILGDLNTALDIDGQGEKIVHAANLRRLHDAGWVDAWREMNPTAREFTLYSHRKNGFRLDHCLVSPKLRSFITSAVLRHDVRLSGLSDHSMVSVCLGPEGPEGGVD